MQSRIFVFSWFYNTGRTYVMFNVVDVTVYFKFYFVNYAINILFVFYVGNLQVPTSCDLANLLGSNEISLSYRLIQPQNNREIEMATAQFGSILLRGYIQ